MNTGTQKNKLWQNSGQVRTQWLCIFFAPTKIRHRTKIWNIGVSKTRDHIQINVMMPNPSWEPSRFYKAPNIT